MKNTTKRGCGNPTVKSGVKQRVGGTRKRPEIGQFDEDQPSRHQGDRPGHGGPIAQVHRPRCFLTRLGINPDVQRENQQQE